MTGDRHIPSMTVAARGAGPVTDAEFEAMLASSSFRAFADLLSAALIILDRSENIILANLAAGKLSGMERSEIEHRPFERFLRRSGLDIDDWLSKAVKGRSDGRVRGAVGSLDLFATRRIIPLTGGSCGYTMLTLQSLRAEPSRSAAQRGKPAAPNLIFPPEIELQIRQAVRAYRRGVRVLLLGESGVGKTAIARHLHAEATDDDPPFVHVNCGSIPETLFESEMFGYERGAFTGALQAGKRGFIESAAGGTLFLDEVGEIPYTSQAKLLKFLEDGTIQPVGSANQRRIETTVITATNRDLPSLVAEGKFRRDLYFRIATFPVMVPSLRDRPDVGQLLDMFLDRVNLIRPVPLRLTERCRAHLLASDFAGNIRELRSLVDYLDIVIEEEADVGDLDPLSCSNLALRGMGSGSHSAVPALSETADAVTLRDRVQNYERDIIEKTVKEAGSQREAARVLGIDVSTLIRKLARSSKD